MCVRNSSCSLCVKSNRFIDLGSHVPRCGLCHWLTFSLAWFGALCACLFVVTSPLFSHREAGSAFQDHNTEQLVYLLQHIASMQSYERNIVITLSLAGHSISTLLFILFQVLFIVG